MPDEDENNAATAHPEPEQETIPLADALADLGKSAGGKVGFKRIGGGKGPGWQGAFYNGTEIQLGGPIFFSGPNIEAVFRKAMELLGGGEYTWFVQTRKGKIIEAGESLFFPGAPRPFPGIEDPARDSIDAYNRYVQQGAQQQQAYGGASSYAQPAGPGLRRVPSGWIWSHGLNAWLWIDEDGALGPPPPGVRAPQVGPGGAGYLSPLHGPSESARESAYREEMKEMRTMLMQVLTAKNGGGSDLSAIIGPMMTSQSAIITAALGANKAGGAERAELEADRRKLDRQGYEALVKQQNALIEKVMAIGPGAKSKLEQTLEDAVVKKVAGTILDGGGEKEKTDGERIGEKVVDGLTSLVDLGKKWMDKPEKPEKPKEQQRQQPQQQQQAPAPNGKANGAAHEDDDIDDDTRCWLLILDAGLEAYQTGRSPAQAFEIMYGTMKGAKIKFDKVHEIIKKLTGKQLLLLLDNGKPAVKAAAAPIISAFSTGDGAGWFESLLQHIRQVSVG